MYRDVCVCFYIMQRVCIIRYDVIINQCSCSPPPVQCSTRGLRGNSLTWCHYSLKRHELQLYLPGRYYKYCTRQQTCATIPTTLSLDSKSWRKQGRCIIHFCCSLWRLYLPLTFDSTLPFTKPKFREKCPKSCRSCGTLVSRSECAFANFHGVHIIPLNKCPVI